MKKEPAPNGSPMHAAASSWLSSPDHKHWLLAEAQKLVDFFKDAVLDPAGGFFELDGDGRPFEMIQTKRSLVTTSRLTHTFALAHLLGHPAPRLWLTMASGPFTLSIVTPFMAVTTGSPGGGRHGPRQAGLRTRPCASRRFHGKGGRDPRSGRDPSGSLVASGETVPDGADRAARRRVRRGLGGTDLVSRTELQHAFRRGADGGSRCDGRSRIPGACGEDRCKVDRRADGFKRLAACRALQRTVGD